MYANVPEYSALTYVNKNRIRCNYNTDVKKVKFPEFLSQQLQWTT